MTPIKGDILCGHLSSKTAKPVYHDQISDAFRFNLGNLRLQYEVVKYFTLFALFLTDFVVAAPLTLLNIC